MVTEIRKAANRYNQLSFYQFFHGGVSMSDFEGVKVNGTFNVKLFYETLARILSNKYGCDITAVEVEKEEKGA